MDLDSLNEEELQEQYDLVELRRDAVTAELQVIGAEINRRHTEATAATFLAGISEGLEPVLIRLATQRLEARTHETSVSVAG